MPAALQAMESSRKRKRVSVEGKKTKSEAVVDLLRGESDDSQAHILRLESQILESRKHYNNIASLLKIFKDCRDSSQGRISNLTAAVSLCRVFCRLMAAGSLTASKGTTTNEVTVVHWLKARLAEYKEGLLLLLGSSDEEGQGTALTLLMRLIKTEDARPGDASGAALISQESIASVVHSLITSEAAEAAREEFVEKYVEEYDDIRYYTFQQIHYLTTSPEEASQVVSNALALLSSISPPDSSPEPPSGFFFTPPPANKKSNKSPLRSLTAHKAVAQSAWLSLINLALSTATTSTIISTSPTPLHTILTLLPTHIIPRFTHPEHLMDFCTDCYALPSPTNYLAISGLFALMTTKNLDYPSFFPKLYSLLTSSLLHSPHRSRFFRLLDTFLSSSHLPAALVASFIKRLARLALYGPPASVVMIVPWIYNLLQRHPTCTFMIHRITTPTANEDINDSAPLGADPYDMLEPDPMRTRALESSLWEMQTMTTHFHPNVATLAKILAEPFTKQLYNLEDFLDHSYGTMMDAELKREMKKTPMVEWEIPKRVFTKKEEGDEGPEDGLLVEMWDFSS